MNASDSKAVLFNPAALARPPFLRASGSSSVTAWLRIAALFPILAAGFFPGAIAWITVLASALAGMTAGNFAAALAQKNSRFFPDSGAVEAALIFACLMPAGVSWALVFGGAFLGAALFQKAWSFKGQYPLHPAAAAYVLLRMGFPVMMSPDVPAVPLSGISRFFLCPGLGFGEQIPAAILAGGILLTMIRMLPLEVPLCFLAVWWVGALSLGSSFVPPGDILFAAFFLVPSFANLPHTFKGRVACALLAGLGAVFFRQIVFVGPGGAAFAVLLAHAAGPWLDRVLRPAGLRSFS